MKISTLLGAAVLAAAGFASTSAAFAQVPGSNYYIERNEELVRQNVAASVNGASRQQQGSVQSYGYAVGERGGAAERPAGVPGSRFFIDRNDEIVRQSIR